jgi:predicted RNA-binding Zn ribbon-like protein
LEELWKESTANHDPVDSLDEELLEEFASAAEDIERFFDGDQNLDETSAVVEAPTGEIKP